MKNLALLTYAWLSTVVFAFVIIWIATVPELQTIEGPLDEAIKAFFRITIYAIFFILFYRSVIMTLKTTVDRLSKWKSKREEVEDAEFVFIIETLVVIVAILGTSLFAVFDEFLQLFLLNENGIYNRSGEVQDILISIMGIMLAAIAVYSYPIIGELEVALKHRIQKGLEGKK